VGTEEDGVDEAGRSAEPPVIVAPPGLDIDPEVKAADEVADNGTMPSSRDAVTGNGNGNGEAPRRGEIATDVPFPADGIGKPKSAAQTDAAGSADGVDDSAEDHSADDRPDGTTTAASSVLDSGRQAVRHAMAATNNLFSTRSAKSDSADSEEDGAPARSRPAMTQGSIMAPPVSTASPAASVFTPAERKPSFTPSSSRDTADAATPSSPASAAPSSSTVPSAPSSASSLSPPSTAPSSPTAPTSPTGSSRTGQPGSGGQSLWREVRRPSPASSSSAPPIGGAAPDRPSDPSRPGGPAGPAGSPPPGSPYSGSGQAYGPQPSGSRPGSSAPGAQHAGAPSGQGFSAAAAAVGGAAAGLAGSVTSAFQNRNTSRNAGAKRKRRPAGVRRSPKRQAQLTLARVEPWSVMKFSFVVSVVAFIILFVAVAVLYMVLSALGVFTSLQHTVSSITSSQGSAGTNISNWFSASRILGYTGMLGALNIVLITAMSTIGAVIYNLIATTIGGVEVTLRETE
jgi:Transmembrane domain of unknown function (DUF3566)